MPTTVARAHAPKYTAVVGTETKQVRFPIKTTKHVPRLRRLQVAFDAKSAFCVGRTGRELTGTHRYDRPSCRVREESLNKGHFDFHYVPLGTSVPPRPSVRSQTIESSSCTPPGSHTWAQHQTSCLGARCQYLLSVPEQTLFRSTTRARSGSRSRLSALGSALNCSQLSSQLLSALNCSRLPALSDVFSAPPSTNICDGDVRR